MECVEWEERARAQSPAAAVSARRSRRVLLVAVASAAVIGVAVLSAL